MMASRPQDSALWPGWPDRQLAAIGADQRLLVTDAQLLGLGVSRSAISRAIGRGRLFPYHRGVHALVPHTALPPLAPEQAAILACGPRAMLSHLSALALWNLCDPYSGPVEVTTIGHDRGRHRPRIRSHRTRRLHRSEVRRRERLFVSSPALTLLESAPSLTGRGIERALDAALTRHLTSRAAIHETLARHPNRAGATILRALLDPSRPSSRTDSAGQERLLKMIRRAGLPSPETEQWIDRYRVDLLWRAQRVIVEFDGWTFHAGRERFEADRARDNWLSNHGWQVIRCTWRQVEREPEVVLVWIATALARADARR